MEDVLTKQDKATISRINKACEKMTLEQQTLKLLVGDMKLSVGWGGGHRDVPIARYFWMDGGLKVYVCWDGDYFGNTPTEYFIHNNTIQGPISELK